MKTVWKVLLGLALVVPMGAYVAGSLVASAAEDDSPPRHTIVLREPGPSHPGASSPTHGPSPSEHRTGDDEVEVITPGYDDLGDDHGQHPEPGDDHGGERGGGHGTDDSSGGSGSGGPGGGSGGSD